MTLSHRKVLIIGAGPAGFTAAIYASRAILQPLVLVGPQPEGQLTITTDVENFPGHRNGVLGPDLMDEVQAQALRLGAEIAQETVTGVDVSASPFQITTEAGVYTCDALIVATGASAKWLGLGRDEELSRKGVTAAGSGCMAAIDAERWLGERQETTLNQLEEHHV